MLLWSSSRLIAQGSLIGFVDGIHAGSITVNYDTQVCSIVSITTKMLSAFKKIFLEFKKKYFNGQKFYLSNFLVTYF